VTRLFALLFLFVAGACHAQGITFRWTGGFAGQVGNSYLPALAVNNQSYTADQWTNLAYVNDQLGTNIAVRSSYGQGINVGFKIGYMINRYVGVDLGVTYQSSSTFMASQTLTFYQPDSTGQSLPTGGYLSCQLSTKSQNLTLSPSVTASFDKPKFKCYPYIRAGLVLPVWTQISHNTTMNLIGVSSYGLDMAPYFLGSQTNVSLQTYGAFSVGFNGAIGAGFHANPFTTLFVEINGQYLSLKATQTNVTQWAADGQDLTGERGAYRLQFNYVNKLTASANNATYNTNYDINSPKQELSPVFPFSNIGFNIGVQLLLNNKIFKDKDGFEETRKRKKPKGKTTEDTNTTTPAPTPTPPAR
jgi:hypothetical protein